MRLDDGLVVSAFPTDADVLDRYLRLLTPDRARSAGRHAPPRDRLPHDHRRVARGVRGHAYCRLRPANPVQNSVRELSTLDDVLAGRPPERNYAWASAPSKAATPAARTRAFGSRARWPPCGGDGLQYGADADHLQVKRGPNGRARALELVKASRYYTFFTLDMADMLHYDALGATAGTSFLDDNVADVPERRAILAVHSAPLQAGDVTCRPSVELVNRFAAKYWDALDAFEGPGP